MPRGHLLESSAVISPCGRYRYVLIRRWEVGQPLVFIMLNPSTAGATEDDPTIRRCIGFGKSNGFDAIVVVNLFAYRATKPADLRSAGYPVGPENDRYIECAARNAGAVCLAWGSRVGSLARPGNILAKLRQWGVQPNCLNITRHGHPQHPLMLHADCRLTPYTAEAIQRAKQPIGAPG